MAEIKPMRPRCHAHNRQGEQCDKLVVPGATVCRYHGGLTPSVQAAARRRLDRLIDPALDVYTEFLNPDSDAAEQVRFAVARDVLDRTGLRVVDSDDADPTPVRITVQFDRANQNPFELPDGA